MVKNITDQDLDLEMFEKLLKNVKDSVNALVERFPEATFYSNTPQWKIFPLKEFNENIVIEISL